MVRRMAEQPLSSERRAKLVATSLVPNPTELDHHTGAVLAAFSLAIHGPAPTQYTALALCAASAAIWSASGSSTFLPPVGSSKIGKSRFFPNSSREVSILLTSTITRR